ncbi:MAG: hypothetical protein ACXVEE_41900, partial [Polyangiales bacterium]
WDLVADAVDGHRVLLGEAKFVRAPLGTRELETEAHRVLQKPPPTPLAGRRADQFVRALFVPAVSRGAPREVASVSIITCADLIGRKLRAARS